MKTKIAVLIASSIIASAANATPFQVTGSINNWKSWNGFSKAPVPYVDAKAGVDLVQGTTANTSVTTPAGSMVINVAGTIDSVTGYGTLFQVGSFTGYFDVTGDGFTDDSWANSGAGGSVTISGLTWTLDATGMHQTGGEAEGCEEDAPQCHYLVNGIIAQEIDITSNYHSVFDFTGINAGFQTLPRSNSTDSAYGVHHYKTWAATPGLAGSWNNFSYTAQLASRRNSGTASFNEANLATLQVSAIPCAVEDPWNYPECPQLPPEEPIVMPVPAAAWLMGSGLLGLAGIARRKK